MELVIFAVAGGGFILIGAVEALTASNSESKTKKTPLSSSLPFILISIFSFFLIVNSFVSVNDAHNSRDGVGSALQFQVIAVALIFLLYSVIGLSVTFSNYLPLPSSLLSLIGVFAFVEEFLMFYLQRKDPSGIENRYYGLLLVPIAVCVFSTILELKSPKSNVPKLGRGVGLILQGTWIVQMGISFFSRWMAHGCYLHKVSRGNYTVKCKGDPEYHRARAIATLQFNCHLALLVVVLVGFYSIISPKNGGAVDSTQYRPLGGEMESFQNSTHVTLDSDDDADERIKEVSVERQKATQGMKGPGSSP